MLNECVFSVGLTRKTIEMFGMSSLFRCGRVIGEGRGVKTMQKFMLIVITSEKPVQVQVGRVWIEKRQEHAGTGRGMDNHRGYGSGKGVCQSTRIQHREPWRA